VCWGPETGGRIKVPSCCFRLSTAVAWFVKLAATSRPGCITKSQSQQADHEPYNPCRFCHQTLQPHFNLPNDEQLALVLLISHTQDYSMRVLNVALNPPCLGH
jgi:hypothetical protein